MATKKSSPNAPGANVSGGVLSTLYSTFQKASKGPQQTMNAPFNAPRAGGDNGLPTRIYDSMGGAKGTPKPSGVSSAGPIMADRKGSK